MHPVNLALRFALELAALAGFGALAWTSIGGWVRFPLAIVAVVAVAALWGTFAVPDDPSRSGNAPVPVPGAVRLGLEFLILFGGAFAFYLSGYILTALILALLIAVHYSLSYARLVWLLQQ